MRWTGPAHGEFITAIGVFLGLFWKLEGKSPGGTHAVFE